MENKEIVGVNSSESDSDELVVIAGDGKNIEAIVAPPTPTPSEDHPRRHIRHVVRVKTLVAAGSVRPFWAKLAEISSSGLSLVTDTSLAGIVKIGGTVVILFLVPSKTQNDQVRVEVSCKLVHEYVSNGQFRCGLAMKEFRSGKEPLIGFISGLSG